MRPESSAGPTDAPPTPESIDPQPAADPPTPQADQADEGDAAVFLKQNGQIYMVRDWDTLKRWIVERRVDQSDLVSEGGVRWEPIGDRPDLLSLFAAPQISEVDAPTEADVPFPFERIRPFPGVTPEGAGWQDEDTDGIPTGLPPLPNERTVELEIPAVPVVPPPDPDPDPAPDIAPPVVVPEGLDADPLTQVGTDEEATELMPMGTVAEAEVVVSETPAPTPRIEEGGQWEDLLAPADDDPWDSSEGEKAALLALTEDAVPSIYREDRSEGGTGQSFAFDEEWDEYELTPTRGGGLWYGAALATALGVGVLLLVLFGPPQFSPQALLAAINGTGAEGSGAEVPEPEPAEAPEPVEAPEPEPAEAPEPEPAEAPEPEPAPEPAPAPRGPSVAALVERGWEQIDGNPSAASRAFREALERAPDNADANYGYGYVLLLQSHPDAAYYLCAARDASTTRCGRTWWG